MSESIAPIRRLIFYRCMSYRKLLSAAALLVFAGTFAQAQTQVPASDFPGASDFHAINRPANSFIIGAMHIDNDEYNVPLGPVEWNSDHLGKSLTATGPIDTIAYAGPTTASSFTTYTGITAQLLAANYKEVWSCVRKTCGSAFHLARILDKPLLDTVHQGNWGFWLNDDLNATNDDIRYGAFRKGDEYVLVMGSLSPGHPSGALIIRVNGPANEPVLSAQGGPPAQAAASDQAAAAPADTTASPLAPRRRLRAAAQAILNKQVPQQ